MRAASRETKRRGVHRMQHDGRTIMVEHRPLERAAVPVIEQSYVIGGVVTCKAGLLAREVSRWAREQRFPREAWEA